MLTSFESGVLILLLMSCILTLIKTISIVGNFSAIYFKQLEIIRRLNDIVSELKKEDKND